MVHRFRGLAFVENQPDLAMESVGRVKHCICAWGLRLTRRILTDRSLRRSSQNAQLPNHLFPSRKAIGSIVLFRMSPNTCPSLPSITRARATASWKSESCFRQTVTASLKLPPRRKKAAAYSEPCVVVSRTLCQDKSTNRIVACSTNDKHFLGPQSSSVAV